jgi:formylglycine-generating enzyme required for sulfatase activity
MPGPETGMLKSAQPVRTKVTLPDEEERIHETSKPLVSAAPVVPTGTDEPKPVEVHNQADVVPPPADEKNAKDQEIAAEKAHVQDAAPAVQSPPAVAPVPQVPQPPSPVTLVREEIAKHLRVIAERTEGDQFLPRAAESIPADSNNLDELRAWETQTKELAAFLGGGNWPGSYDRNQFYLSQDGQRLLEQKPLQPADLRAWRAALGGYPIDAGLFVRIPAGRQEIPLELRLIRAKGLWFQMGIPRGAGNRTEEVSDPPQRVVPLSSDFYLGRYEITQRQYQAVTGENPSLFQTDHPNDPNRPVERVSWDQAVAFCAKLSGREDLRFFLRHGRQYREYNIKGPVFRLPEEREWEYACRGQEGMRENPPASWPEYLDFHNTYHRQDLGTVCWYAQRTIDAGTCPVGGRNPNSFGLYDMHGNVWEWCRGDYQDTEGGRLGGTGHIVRGGAYDSRWSECRSGWRDGYAKPRENIGFRVVLEVP